ncbi:endonuclease domain-containing protein [Acidipropionibacterium jensenii]|uniref:DUF559 domain-containing protein n=1 Tax=Acidipropionibacterium jensenii TaxID=1749 RepID=A0A3S4YQJ9_9ACTN|nr:DUF559 domain-containing protein [Acidipropionibacterium jensenii]AZZ38917.1 DUF559 domain-containing protein [Acidipropionibacterium jensenii]MDN5978022.1 endonuclease domain-containing protein [Acidipropionibacterium jensenii]MDN6592811.1 endonuclease domain-containing protein [Acidipropionibacterium jensenii]MDN6761316.1 endonuclease domain-containing protein [Acidipropionibacterium jensenii]QCV88319.1 DUF559 domain-containing protein [Acidipropionibacterium jensenii]
MKHYDIPPQLRPGGVVSTRVLRSAGYSYPDISKLHLSGDLVENLRPGWWSLRDADPEVVAAVRAGGVMTCVSALARFGVFRPFGDTALHVRASRGTTGSKRVQECSPGRRPAPIRAIDDPLVAVRAAIRCLDRDNGVAVLDSMVNLRVATMADLALELADSPRARALLSQCDRAESGTETLVRIRLRGHNVQVASQVTIPGVGRVDLLVGERLVIEVDSRAHHTSEQSYQADRVRDRRLLALGYRVMRLTWEDVMFGWPQAQEQILTVVRRGDHHWPRRRAHRGR